MAYIDRSLQFARTSHPRYQPFAFSRDHAVYTSGQINRRSFAMTLVKDDLIQKLYDQSGFSKQKARTTVETIFELVKKALESGEAVLISGFGKFSVKKKAAQKGRNPATAEDLTLDPRRVIAFKCSPVMRDRTNGEG
jgi:integration host factor subunit alpha